MALVSILNRARAFVSPKRHHINFLGGSKLGDIHGKSSTFSVKNILEDFVSTEIRTRDGWIKDFLVFPFISSAIGGVSSPGNFEEKFCEKEFAPYIYWLSL